MLQICLVVIIRPNKSGCGSCNCTQVATPTGNYFLTRVLAPFGDDAVAAWAVLVPLKFLAFGGIFGQNFGAGQFNRLRGIDLDALVFCLIYTLLMWGY